MTPITPATPLPWWPRMNSDGQWIVSAVGKDGGVQFPAMAPYGKDEGQQNIRYIVHAANELPKCQAMLADYVRIYAPAKPPSREAMDLFDKVRTELSGVVLVPESGRLAFNLKMIERADKAEIEAARLKLERAELVALLRSIGMDTTAAKAIAIEALLARLGESA